MRKKLVVMILLAIAGFFVGLNYRVAAQAVIETGSPRWFMSLGSDPGTCRAGDFVYYQNVDQYKTCDSHNVLATLLKSTDASTTYAPLAHAPGFAEVFLTAAQVKNLIGTPIQIVAAPGANYALKPYVVAVTYHGMGATPYTVTGAGNLVLLWGTTNFASSHSPSLANTILTQSADELGYFATGVEGQFDTHDDTENQPLMLSQDGMSEFAAGTAAVQIEVFYVTVPVH